MARPGKSEDDKRELTIRLRATASEKSRIWQNAKNAGLTPSDFLRGQAINARPARTVPTPDREVLLKLLAELNMHGSNLNQMTRALNRRQDSADFIGIDERHVSHTLHGIDKLLSTLTVLLTA